MRQGGQLQRPSETREAPILSHRDQLDPGVGEMPLSFEAWGQEDMWLREARRGEARKVLAGVHSCDSAQSHM